MNPKTGRLVLTVLLIIGVILPIAVAFLCLFARILSTLGDTAFGAILDATAIVLTLVWLVDLVVLVFVIALRLIVKEGE